MILTDAGTLGTPRAPANEQVDLQVRGIPRVT
jgi:hypothetical protein